MTDEPLREPPHDLPSERAVLSAVLIDAPTLFSRVRALVRAEHFYSEAHRRIYEAALGLAERHDPVDSVTVWSWLEARNRGAQVGGMAYLAGLLVAAPSLANAEAYARTVFEKWRVRQALLICHRVLARGYHDHGEVQAFLDHSASALREVARDDARRPYSEAREVFPAFFDELKVRSVAPAGTLVGIPTGLARLDQILGGWQPGKLYTIAGRPGHGKTSLALGACIAAAKATGDGVALFSLEMPKEEIAECMMSMAAWIGRKYFRTGDLSPSQWEKAISWVSWFSRQGFIIDDSPGLTLEELRSKLSQWIDALSEQPNDQKPGQKRKPALVVVDYLQLMKGPASARTRDEAIGAITRELKAMSKEFRIPIVELAQLNRDLEKRSDKRPQLSDLRESGSIEQDSDAVLFVYRESVYTPKPENLKRADIVVGKQRGGKAGITIHAEWHGWRTGFADTTDEPTENDDQDS